VLQNEYLVVENVLEVLTKPPGTAESQDIHHTILALCAPGLKTGLKSTEATNTEHLGMILEDCPVFTLSTDRHGLSKQTGVLRLLQSSMLNLVTSTSSLDIAEHVDVHDIPVLIDYAVEIRGADATLNVLTTILLQLSDNHQFLFALDAVATIICMTKRGLNDALRLQYQNLGGLLKNGDVLTAEALVRLYRQVELYTNLLSVPEMDAFDFTQQLTDIDTANPDLDAAIAVPGVDMQMEQTQADGIDRVLDEAAAMGNLDPNDADMSFDDALYGANELDLNDLDLDMF